MYWCHLHSNANFRYKRTFRKKKLEIYLYSHWILVCMHGLDGRNHLRILITNLINKKSHLQKLKMAFLLRINSLHIQVGYLEDQSGLDQMHVLQPLAIHAPMIPNLSTHTKTGSHKLQCSLLVYCKILLVQVLE